MSSSLLDSSLGLVSSLFLWLVVPPFLTRLLLGQYYRIRHGGGAGRPREESLQYGRHYRTVYVLVVLGYLAYSMAEHLAHAPPSFYCGIGVSRGRIDEDLKNRFRQSVLSMHPDKNPTVDPQQFLRLKEIYAVLSDRTSRAIYDCYGPEVLNGVNAAAKPDGHSPADFLLHAIVQYAVFYASTSLFFIISAGMGRSHGFFWRLNVLFTLASLELYVLLHPLSFGIAHKSPLDDTWCLGWVVRQWQDIPVYQKVSFLRQAYMYSGMAFGQIAGLFRPPEDALGIGELIGKIEANTQKLLRREAEYQLETAIGPVMDNPAMQDLLRRKTESLMAELELHAARQ